MQMLQWNEEYQVYVDQQGLMIPRSDLWVILQKMKIHLEHTPLELEAIGRRTVEENHPRMVNQFDFDYFK